MSRIDPKKEYNLSQILKAGMLPYRDIRTIRKIVQRDMWGDNLLKAHVSGADTGKDYKIKGKHIIKFLEKYGPGLAVTVPKQVR